MTHQHLFYMNTHTAGDSFLCAQGVCIRRGVSVRSRRVKDDVCVNVSDTKENWLLLCSPRRLCPTRSACVFRHCQHPTDAFTCWRNEWVSSLFSRDRFFFSFLSYFFSLNLTCWCTGTGMFHNEDCMRHFSQCTGVRTTEIMRVGGFISLQMSFSKGQCSVGVPRWGFRPQPSEHHSSKPPVVFKWEKIKRIGCE